MKELILLGAGGHAKACLDVISTKKQYKVSFLVGKNNINNSKIFDNKKIISEITFNKKNKKIKKNIFIAIGQLKIGKNREQLFDYYKKKIFFSLLQYPQLLLSLKKQKYRRVQF